MTLPASGPLAMTDIQTEFGGTNPIGMNEYYAGGGLVPAGTTGTFGAVPSSGALSVQNFYGTSNYIPVYIEELFSTWLYTGNAGTQVITNGINLSGNGGLVWLKQRNGGNQHLLLDSARGVYSANSVLNSASAAPASNDNNPPITSAVIQTLNTTGFTLGTGSGFAASNQNGSSYVSWTFREQPKFFDIVTYTGNGVAGRQISHLLGSTPGMVIVKDVSASNAWYVWHRGLTSGNYIILNATAAQSSSFAQNIFGNGSTTVDPTSTNFTVGNFDDVNGSGKTYVAYLFAHNAGGFGLTGTDNVISCGGGTTDGNGLGEVTLGWEPQFVLYRLSNTADDWRMLDTMRGWTVFDVQDDKQLTANQSSAETTGGQRSPLARGFNFVSQGNQPFIYIAIRRGPMKVPTTGTSVYQPVTYAGNDANRVITAGFPVDMAIFGLRDTATSGKMAVTDRLRGRNQLLTTQTSAEATADGLQANPWDLMTGVKVSGDSGVTNFTPWQYIDWNFRRAPSFFDEVCYAGTGGNAVYQHNLGVTPEMVIIKARDFTTPWPVYHVGVPGGFIGRLNIPNPIDASNNYQNTITGVSPTTFSTGASGGTGGAGFNYVAYLFASCPGVSKLGSFTGTGATQVINCGFTGGARFVLIKSTSTTGDWLVWDSARGIVAGNDPYLAWNSTAAEVTGTDWVDTAASGFELSNSGGNLVNSSGVTYIFWAVA